MFLRPPLQDMSIRLSLRRTQASLWDQDMDMAMQLLQALPGLHLAPPLQMLHSVAALIDSLHLQASKSKCTMTANMSPYDA